MRQMTQQSTQVAEHATKPYLNIEPFHFPTEAVIHIRPQALPTLSERQRGATTTYALLLDDTASPGSPVFERDARDLIESLQAAPCLFVLETDLVSLAWAVLRTLRPDDCRVHRTNIDLLTGNGRLVVFRGVNRAEVTQVLYGDPTLFPTTEAMLAVGRPSCSVYTLAWYYFRLMTSAYEWTHLAGLSDRSAIRERINAVATNVPIAERPPGTTTLLTYLPYYLESTEDLTMSIADHLMPGAMRAALTAEGACRNEYYGGPDLQ